MTHAGPAFASETQARDALRTRAREGRAWFTDAALPLWWRQGFDAGARCYHERLELNGEPAPGPRRVRVQARQTAVYAIAGGAGWNGPWRDAVEAGLAVITGPALRPDGAARHMLDERGAPLDSRRDLYDLAFIIFALAHAARALQRPALIDAANAHLQWIDAHWRHPHGGYLEGEVNPIPPRRQNPHMHFFEAMLALYETTGDDAHLARAHELADLFAARFCDSARGALPEFFDDTWRPASGDAGRHIEPGHHFEWSWLLQRYSLLSKRPLSDAASRLCATAETYGVDPARGVARDAMWIDGTPKSEEARLWPQTERVKAHAGLYALTGDLAHASAAAAAFDTLMAYLDTPVRGLWRDRMLADGRFVEEPAPASSFYHIVLALEAFWTLFDAG